MSSPLMVLVNPAAGRSGYRSRLGRVLEILYNGGWLPTVYFTGAPGRAVEIAAKEAERYERLICLGGDGTLSDVISGLMRLPKEARPELGYIPMGTANDMAATLCLSRDAEAAAKNFLKAEPRPIDVGAMGEDAYFTYIAAFGALTEVSYETDQETKNALGPLAYVLQALARLTKISSYQARVEYDGGVIEEELLFGGVSNTTSLGGLLHLDEKMVGLGDGLFEVILVKNPKTPGEFNSIVTGMMNQDYNGPALTVLHSRRVRFTFEKPVAWTRDGENGGLYRELVLENRFRAVRIIA